MMRSRPCCFTPALVAAALVATIASAFASPPGREDAPRHEQAARPDPAYAKPIERVWVYAKDPGGGVPFEAIYDGRTVTFGPDAAHAFQLGQSRIALKRTWELRGAEGDTFRVRTEYGPGRRNDLTLKLRSDARGAVVGMKIREGDGSTGARYYVPRPS